MAIYAGYNIGEVGEVKLRSSQVGHSADVAQLLLGTLGSRLFVSSFVALPDWRDCLVIRLTGEKKYLCHFCLYLALKNGGLGISEYKIGIA